MYGGAQLPSINFTELKLPSPVTQLHSDLLNEKKVQLFIKRDELIHPVLQGNKWRKLKYNLLEANIQKQKTLLSFGGAYSNHLHALAYAGKHFGFNTIGIIRGEKPANLNPCLQDIKNWGMQLEYIKRIDYKQKITNEFIHNLRKKFSDFYLIPEGGNNPQGIKGCAEILNELDRDYDVICCEVGSGTMFSSMITHNKKLNTHFLGFVVMKNRQLEDEIRNTTTTQKNIITQWSLIHTYHFGGFAKASTELHQFIANFKTQFNIQLEPVYSGKMLYGIFDLINKDHFKPGARILAIHGGGLQGLRGYPEFYPTN
jgi:1-aminocyclopropane-1-carboxylate deaminase/D-cysteine desulfhydrase-like pyridoxal-dependent ACC family enzyme